MSEWLIETKGLTKVYGAGETAVRALDDVNLAVTSGEFFAIMGPSGCGKSTLLNLLGGLDQPTAGEVWVAGQDLARIKNMDDFRANTVGFVFQLHNLLPTLTAQENVEVPMQGRGLSSRSRRERALHLLDLVGLGDRTHHLPNQLSGGQRQRIAIARALANSPALILADEPTGALDSNSGQEILSLLGQLNRSEGTTIAVVTHDPRVAQATQRILRMQDGRLVEDLAASQALRPSVNAPSRPVRTLGALVNQTNERSRPVQRTDILVLYDYNDWANQRILATAARLTPEQLLAETGLSKGSVRDVLVHMLGAEQVWRQRLQEGIAPTSLLAPQAFATLDAIVALWREEAQQMRAYLAGLTHEQLNGRVTYRSTKGQPFENVLWQVLAHVVNHGTQHRAEVAHVLTTYGHSPGDMDLILFAREARYAASS